MMRARGFVYTLFAIAMVASITMLLSLQSAYRPSLHVAEKIRSTELVYLERGILSDLERGTYISGRRATLTLVGAEVTSGSYNNTSNESIKDIMLSGAYNGSTAPLMANATLASWADTVESLSASMGYTPNILIKSVRVSEKGAFSIELLSSAEVFLADERLSMQLNRTGNLSAEMNIEGIEDPFVAIESFGYTKQQITKCNSTAGTGGSSDWEWGTAYVNLTQTNFSNVQDKNKKVLIINTISGKSDYGGFAAIVSESQSDSPPAPYIIGASGATAARMGSLVVKQNNTLWMTNITDEPANSCYFEAPGGPSFLDRLEGTKTLSQKYRLPGVNVGIGSFIYVPGLPLELQHGSDTYAIDYEYFA